MSTDIASNQAAKDMLSTVASSVSGQKPAQANTIRQTDSVPAGNDLPASEENQPVNEQQLREVVEQLNDHVQAINRDLHFSVDDDSGKTIIKVTNSETEELIRQIPSEEVLRISRNLAEQFDDATGLLFQTSV